MAYWLDRLPPQPVLDGLEPFNILTRNLEVCPVELVPLPSFDPTVKSSVDEFRYTLRDFMEEFR